MLVRGMPVCGWLQYCLVLPARKETGKKPGAFHARQHGGTTLHVDALHACVLSSEESYGRLHDRPLEKTATSVPEPQNVL
jgi:hypothetical protein